jgi:CheY-like chemotaxis protein
MSRVDRKTILVAEDSEETRTILKSILELKGYNVIEAEDGSKALEMVKRKRPDLILLDLKMPQLNGLAVTRLIRQRPEFSNTPIVIISGYDPEQHGKVAAAAGCTEYVKKPIDFDHLGSVLERLLNN